MSIVSNKNEKLYILFGYLKTQTENNAAEWYTCMLMGKHTHTVQKDHFLPPLL